ncbi:MAG: hypothetical protein OHK0046_07510 [Anaerolineae bacterium]
MSENNTPPTGGYTEIEYVVTEVPAKRPSLLRRVGCGCLLVIWFTVLLLPLFLFILAADGEIRFGHSGDVPDKHEHPLFEVKLVSEIDFRGLSITNSTIERPDDTNLCVQTNVRYLLWQGEGEAATFCDCYTRETTESTWQLTGTNMAACGEGT